MTVFEILAVLRPVVSTSVSGQIQRCVSGSDAACQACSSFRLARSSQPQPSAYSWDCPQTAITTLVSLCLSSSHHPSPCPSTLAIGVWTSGLGKWQEESTKLTRQMSSGSVFYPDFFGWKESTFYFSPLSWKLVVCYCSTFPLVQSISLSIASTNSKRSLLQHEANQEASSSRDQEIGTR